MQIYLDHSATTPPRPEVIAAMQVVLAQDWGNPSSLHHWGARAALWVERARLQVADLIQAEASETIVFTSGGTEADNLALIGVARRYDRPQHLIISSVEHSAVAEPAKLLARQGWAVTQLPVDRSGRVNPEDLRAALRPDTALVSVLYGQSEVGTLQPIQALGEICREAGVLFHTDAVQVAGRLPLDLGTLPVDLLSLSSHKLYGPQGAGALYVRPGVELVPLLQGGAQERGLRSGTQAVPAIAGFGVAAALAAQEQQANAAESQHLILLRDHLFEQLRSVRDLQPTGNRLHRLPHHVSFCVEGVSGRELVRQMDWAGIALSSGSACNSGKLTPSPVLKAMGYSDRQAMGAIRLTLGRSTTLADIDWTAQVLRQVLAQLLPVTVGCP